MLPGKAETEDLDKEEKHSVPAVPENQCASVSICLPRKVMVPLSSLGFFMSSSQQPCKVSAATSPYSALVQVGRDDSPGVCRAP